MDFDGGGKLDFLIANHWPALTADCRWETALTVIVFDRAGRLVQWWLDSQVVDEPGREFPSLPIREKPGQTWMRLRPS